MPKIIHSHDFCQILYCANAHLQLCYLMKMKIKFEAYVSQCNQHLFQLNIRTKIQSRVEIAFLQMN